MKNKSVTVAFPIPMLDAIKARANKDYTNKSAVIRQAVAFFFAKEEGIRRSKQS